MTLVTVYLHLSILQKTFEAKLRYLFIQEAGWFSFVWYWVITLQTPLTTLMKQFARREINETEVTLTHTDKKHNKHIQYSCTIMQTLHNWYLCISESWQMFTIISFQDNLYISAWNWNLWTRSIFSWFHVSAWLTPTQWSPR